MSHPCDPMSPHDAQSPSLLEFIGSNIQAMRLRIKRNLTMDAEARISASLGMRCTWHCQHGNSNICHDRYQIFPSGMVLTLNKDSRFCLVI